MTTQLFADKKPIRLGIWGLGRGSNFSRLCQFLNIEIVAGCDYNDWMREKFLKNNPNAFVTANDEEFLRQDFDVALVATFFPDHAEHSIRALNAGKHVLCEVTSFFTPAQGVELIEAVEKSGKIYNLLENYPYMAPNRNLRRLWREGFFGDFMYAEFDYNHDCRPLGWTYIDGVPVQPGYTVHNWRSVQASHYYATHSLGPVMLITGLRPVQITAYMAEPHLPGLLKATGLAPSLIKMSNGGIVRNLVGAGTGDTHAKRIWGTLASCDATHKMEIRVGARGGGRRLSFDPVDSPEEEEVAKLARDAGHGGGDFWELYNFAREFHGGQKADWDVYSAADVTLAGIMAVRSAEDNNATLEIPDFRDINARNKYRNDNRIQKRLFEPDEIFPENLRETAKNFTQLMCKFDKWGTGADNVVGTCLVRQALDGMKLFEFIQDDDKKKVIHDVKRLVDALPEFAEACKEAQELADKCKGTVPERAIREFLEAAEAPRVLNTQAFVDELNLWLKQHDN